MNKPTVEELAAELACAYTVIMEALPLALGVIKTGGIDLAEQQYFWYSINEMEHHVDLLDLDNEADPLDPSLIERRDELYAFCHQPATEKPTPEDQIKSQSIDDLSFSTRTINSLKIAYPPIITIGDLVQRSKRDLLRTKGMGSKQLNEIGEVLGNMGLSLAQYDYVEASATEVGS